MDEPYLELRELEFLGQRWWLAVTTQDLCVILTYFQDGQRLALRQSRPEIDGRVLGPPMGAFPRTSPTDGLDSARREAEYETGYEVRDIRFLFSVYRSPGLTNQRAHIYVATATTDYVGQTLHSDEDIEVITLPKAFTSRDVLTAYPDDHVDAAFWYYFLPDAQSAES